MKFGPYIQRFLILLFSGRIFTCCLHLSRGHFLLLPFIFSSLFGLITTNLSAQCVVSCKNSLNVSLGINGTATMTPGILLVDPDCNPANFTVTITDNQGHNYGNLLTCANIGQTLTALVRETATGNACATTLVAYDYLPPFISCKDTTILCIESTDPAILGFPMVSDNCANLNSSDLSYSDVVNELECFTLHNGDSITTHIARTWTAVDNYGNSSSCIQNIYLRRATIADIDFPAHRNGFSMPAVDCNADPYDLAVVGEPTINGRRIEIGGYCEFVVAYSDQILDICSPAGYKIIRTWTVIDWCSDDFILHAQIIKVEDATAPQILCPADITVGTDVDDCSASVLLPNASATDDCSTFTITPSWAFGTGYGPFANIPMGIHEVTYTAEDACGNKSTCTINLTVVDVVPPTAVCDYSTVVDLSSDGQGIVYATSFDDGSNDNCTMGDVLVSKYGQNFGPTITFDCQDLAVSPIDITLRVFDAVGNFNDCTVHVYVEDKLVPVIVCPATVYLDCFEDYTDLNITGQPLIQDNCGIDTLFFSDNLQLNSCNVGYIIRTWTTRDFAGNSRSCLQWIYLEDPTPITVSFPSHYSTDICGAVVDPSVTGNPVLTGDDCELVYVGYTDDTLSIAPPACYTIHRNWQIIDWCNHDPNANPVTGYWTFTQIITVNDFEDPVIQCPADITVSSFSANCGGALVNLPMATATDCSSQISITNNSSYALNNGADASGTYPIGNHQVRFTAEDGCGNSSYCVVNITVVDGLSPQAVCLDGLSLELGESGMVTLLPAMLDAGSTDNCTPTNELSFEVIPNVFSCDDLGDNEVSLIVRDANGNEDICIATVNIQNNMGFCPFVQLGGYLTMENGKQVSGVEVKVNDGQAGSMLTGADGYFHFENLPVGGNYTITPSKLTKAGNGVSTIDLILISRHLLGTTPITSPYQKIAADVDNNGRINTFDIIQIQKMVLFIDTIYPKSPSWRFIDANYTFSNPDNPFSSPFPQELVLNNQGDDLLDGNFIAIKMGDVNRNANPLLNAQQSGSDRGETIPLGFVTEDQSFRKGEEVVVPIRTKTRKELLGFQFTLAFDKSVLEFANLEFTDTAKALGFGESNFSFGHLDRGMLTASWYEGAPVEWSGDAECFVLRFKAKQDGTLSDLLQINSALTTAEAYEEYSDFLEVHLEYTNTTVKEPQTLLENNTYNFPNPFSQSTTIVFEMAKGENARLTVLNRDGKIVYESKQWYDRGRQKIFLNKEVLGTAKGMYYYRLEMESGATQMGKMLRI